MQVLFGDNWLHSRSGDKETPPTLRWIFLSYPELLIRILGTSSAF